MVWPLGSDAADEALREAASQAPGANASEAEGEQSRMARQVLVNGRARLDEIGAWSVMNANLQSHQMAAKAAGLDPEKSVIPWGSTHVTHNINQDQSIAGLIPKAIMGAVAALGLGASTAGLVGLASGLFSKSAGEPSAYAPASIAAEPVEYEWILDVERNHEFRGKFERAASDREQRSGSSDSGVVGDQETDP